MRIALPMCTGYKMKMLIRRKFARQGKTSEGNEAVVAYGDLTESPDNAVLRILYNQHRVAKADATQDNYAD